MMWWTENENENYDVTIGGEGGVRANTNSAYLFSSFTSLNSIDLTYLDTSQVTDMSYMFSNSWVATLDLSPLDTSQVTNMTGMFTSFTSPNLVDFSNFVIGANTDISDMFFGSDLCDPKTNFPNYEERKEEIGCNLPTVPEVPTPSSD